LVLRKIIKIVATRCNILKLKYTKFDFGWGSVPDPARGSAPPNPQAIYIYIRRPTSKGREGWKDEREGQGMGKKGRDGTYF